MAPAPCARRRLLCHRLVSDHPARRPAMTHRAGALHTPPCAPRQGTHPASACVQDCQEDDYRGRDMLELLTNAQTAAEDQRVRPRMRARPQMHLQKCLTSRPGSV